VSNSTKTQEDLALVQEIIGVDPLDFARWAGGELVIILPDGRKLLLMPDQVTRALVSGEYRLNAVPAHGRGRPRKEAAS
jgi:hypothetical protein